MLRSVAQLLPGALRAHAALQAPAAVRGFKAVSDMEVDLNNREVLKKYIGIRDHLSQEPGTRSRFIAALKELLDGAKVLPAESGYRKAVEATANYRLKVAEQNDADAAIEEVLDAHLEELIKECKEESRLFTIITGTKPWDVPADYTVPVVDYLDAAQVMQPPPPPPKK